MSYESHYAKVTESSIGTYTDSSFAGASEHLPVPANYCRLCRFASNSWGLAWCRRCRACVASAAARERGSTLRTAAKPAMARRLVTHIICRLRPFFSSVCGRGGGSVGKAVCTCPTSMHNFVLLALSSVFHSLWLLSKLWGWFPLQGPMAFSIYRLHCCIIVFHAKWPLQHLWWLFNDFSLDPSKHFNTI